MLVAVSILGLLAATVGACGSGLGTPPPTRVRGASTPVPGATTAPRPSVGESPGGAFRELVDFPGGGAFEVTGATVTADGYVAVGFGAIDGDDYFGRRQGIVWRSANGERWEESRDEALIDVTPLRVTSLGADLFLLGSADAGQNETGYAIWRSSRGGPWQRLAPPPGMLDAIAVDELVAGRDRLFAYGSLGDESESPTVWSSLDGQSWNQTTELGGLDPLTAFGATPTGFIAFGSVVRAGAESADLGAVFSTDGTRFGAAAVPSIPDAGIDDVAVGVDGVVGVGRAYGDETDVRGLALYSPDGASWIEGSATDGSFDEAPLAAAHAVATGYVALGYALDQSDFGIQDGRAWISADGQRWRALASIGEVSLITASASGAAGLVVFSADQLEDETGVTSTIAAWFAPSSILLP